MKKNTYCCLVLFMLLAALSVVCGCSSSPTTQQPVPSTTQPTELTYEEHLRVHPPAPVNVQATLLADHIVLHWDAPALVSVPHVYSDTVSYYRIYKGTTENDVSYFMSTTGRSFSDYNISGSRQYVYRVTAVQTGDMESDTSNTADIRISPGMESGLTYEEYRRITPPAPENLTGSFKSNHIELHWDAPATVSVQHVYSDTISYYKIYKGTTEDNLSYFTSTTGRSFSDYKITGGHQYIYQITAMQNGNLESSASIKILITTG